SEHQHQRYNPLKGEWVLVSPHRALRPWSGQTELPPVEVVPEFDPKNPLCPGVKRSSGAIWASNFIPNEPKAKDQHQREYYEKYGRPLLQDYVKKELEKKERIVYENDEWVIVVPYWAVWPYETLVLPKRQIQRFVDLDNAQKETLAKALKAIVAKYDNIFKCNFPYSMGWHGAPTGNKFDEEMPYWTFHGCYYPPLLRSATVKKFMVGYEMLAQSQRDITPETAASILRSQSEVRFS
ncbi:GalP UDP tr C and/or HIT domain containing protein, partial [Asbolus verrucosus]